jgi:hypothetical protein
MRLIETVMALGQRIAFIIDRAHYLDDVSMRIIAESVSRWSQRGSSAGRWIWFMLQTPILGGMSVESLQLIRDPPPLTLQLHEMSRVETEATFRHFTFWNMTDDTFELFQAKSGGMPGLIIEIMKEFGPRIFQLVMAYRMGKISSDRIYMAPSLRAELVFTDLGHTVFQNATYRDLVPKFMGRLVQFCDVLQPRQQVLLKVVAIVTDRKFHCPISLACSITAQFLPDASEGQLLAQLRTLHELLILHVDEAQGTCWFRAPVMREVVFELLTPLQITAVSKIAAGMLSTNDKTIQDCLRTGRLYCLAGIPSGCQGSLRKAWEHCLELRKQGDTTTSEREPFNLWNSPEYVVYHGWQQTGQPIENLAVDGNVPQNVVDRPYDAFNKVLPRPIIVTKNCEPPLILGPLGGMVQQLAMTLSANYVVATGLVRPVPVSNAQEYIRLTARFERFVPIYNDPEMRITMPWAAEKEFIRKACKPTNDPEKSVALCEAFQEHLESVIRPRARRLRKYIASVVDYKSSTKIEDRSKQRLALEEAFDKLKHVDESGPSNASDLVREALLRLGVCNWQSPYPYMIPAKLRDAWLVGWIPPLDLKAIFLVFLMESETGSIELATKSTFSTEDDKTDDDPPESQEK